MATYIGVGPAAQLDGPLPQPPEHSLLSIPGVVQTDDVRWRTGVAMWGYPAGTPYMWEPCSDGTFREKSPTTELHSPRFDPFVSYFAFECSTISGPPADFADRAELVLDATISWSVEEALSDGISGSSNPFFGDGNLTQLGSDGLEPRVGLSYLENVLYYQSGRRGIIHATPGIVAQWENLRMDGGVLRTQAGTPIAVGGGYVNVAPVGQTAADPNNGKDWAFVTGPVVVYLGEATRPTTPQFVDPNTNLATYFAERYVVAAWDTAIQFGVLIDWASCPCEPEIV